MPTDDAVKAGADLFAEGMVLSTGMLAIGVEVVRKARSDAAAAEKKARDDILLKEKKELKLQEKERGLREQLTRLETRMMEVENAKFATLHEKLLHEQQKHLLVTENLLKRIHYLEHELKITTPYPLLPSHRPPSHPSNQKTPVQVAAETLQQQEKQQDQGLYQTMRDQTNKLFAYSSSSFFQTDTTNPTQPQQSKGQIQDEDELMLAEEDLVHHLLDTKLPEICTITTPETCAVELQGLAHGAADLVIEATTLPEEENLDEFKGKDSSDILVQMDQMTGNVANATTMSKPVEIEVGAQDPFPAVKPLPHQPHQPHLVDVLPPPKPIPSSKAHLSVKI